MFVFLLLLPRTKIVVRLCRAKNMGSGATVKASFLLGEVLPNLQHPLTATDRPGQPIKTPVME